MPPSPFGKKDCVVWSALLSILLLASCAAEVTQEGGKRTARIRFSEVGREAGITHTQHGSKAVPATGAGAVFFDYDNDGWVDLFATDDLGPNHLYRNNGDGTFTETTRSAGLFTEIAESRGAAVGDYDNDGWTDLFVCNVGDNQLFHNNGDGTFTDVSRAAGLKREAEIPLSQVPPQFEGFRKTARFMKRDERGRIESVSAAFGDYNNDGLLDLYVANYINDSNRPSFPNWACFANVLYRNEGNGTFTDVSEELGVDNFGCSLAMAWTDIDTDGDLDLYLVNDFGQYAHPDEPYIPVQCRNRAIIDAGNDQAWQCEVRPRDLRVGCYCRPNAVYRNDGPMEDGVWKFTEIAPELGLDAAFYGMGVAPGDYDRDGDLDYYVTNLGRNVLYQNAGNGDFIDRAVVLGVGNLAPETGPDALSGTYSTSWAAEFFDVENDGWLDLFVSNGLVSTYRGMQGATFDPDKLFRNNGDGTFTDIGPVIGLDDMGYGRSAPLADYDNDGDVDLLVARVDEAPLLYRNDTEGVGHWIEMRLEGTASNRSGIGARVWVILLEQGEEMTLLQELAGGTSHQTQRNLILHFGLGDATTLHELQIRWPSGQIDVHRDIPADRIIHVVEGEGWVQQEPVPPP